jgi:hypothetical protein
MIFLPVSLAEDAMTIGAGRNGGIAHDNRAPSLDHRCGGISLLNTC